MLLFAGGSGISFYEGIHKLMSPEPVGDPTISYVVLAVAAVFEIVVWILAYRHIRRISNGRGVVQTIRQSKDPNSFIVLLEDSAALLGVGIAALGIWLSSTTGDPVYDALATLAIAIVLAATAVFIGYEVKSLLIGAAVSDRDEQAMRDTITRCSDPEATLVRFQSIHLGPDTIVLNLDLGVPEAWPAQRLFEVKQRLQAAIAEAQPEVRHLSVDVAPRQATTARAMAAAASA